MNITVDNTYIFGLQSLQDKYTGATCLSFHNNTTYTLVLQSRQHMPLHTLGHTGDNKNISGLTLDNT